MKFEIEHSFGDSRAGKITTSHGAFETPAFMPVGTQGTVKTMMPRALEEIGAQIILSNTYHLYLRPGNEILEQAGGLHRFMGWNGPILTDSGGYQVFSLSDLRTINEEGVNFRSHLDGSSHFFSPEKVVDIQRVIGSDIMMVLDECPPYPATEEYARTSNELTVRWAKRCQDQFRRTSGCYEYEQTLFAIVQGSIFPSTRLQSVEALMEMDFEGYAIGGMAVGEPANQMYDIISLCTNVLPKEKPRYLMGVGTPENLLEGIERGIDMFDCVLPTRNGRNAMLFTSKGQLNMTNAQFKNDMQPADDACKCYVCLNFSRAYLRHLFQSKEILALQLASHHNLSFFLWLMREARSAIKRNQFHQWKQETLASMQQRSPVYS